jgi:hypothetical protein
MRTHNVRLCWAGGPIKKETFVAEWGYQANDSVYSTMESSLADKSDQDSRTIHRP